MHFVFYADRYETYEKALDHPYGITVMAILFLVSVGGKYSGACGEILKKISNLKN